MVASSHTDWAMLDTPLRLSQILSSGNSSREPRDGYGASYQEALGAANKEKQREPVSKERRRNRMRRQERKEKERDEEPWREIAQGSPELSSSSFLSS